MSDFAVVTSVTIPKQRIADLMTSALEGGSRYWLAEVFPRYPNHQAYSEASAYDDGMVARVFYADDEPDDPRTFDRAAIQRGLELMPTVAGGRHWADFMQENDDAETADVFLQLCLFGEVVYG